MPFTELTKEIIQTCDSGQFACGVFLDLQNAFDTINHNILLRKLEHYGIRGVSNIWFKSYLTKREQHTYHGGIILDDKLIEYRVLQGSVLGPLLFIIIINYLYQAIETSSVHHSADDTNLLLIDK